MRLRQFWVLGLTLILLPTACASRRVGPPVQKDNAVDRARLDELMRTPEIPLAQSADYRISPGDILTVYLIGRPDILGPEPTEVRSTPSDEQGLKVTDNPVMVFPQIGPIKVHGKTALQLQDELRDAYDRIIVNPKPVVVIRKFSNNQMAVLGTVNKPGIYTWEPGDTLIDALLKAGGIGGGRPESSSEGPGPYIKVYREKFGRQGRTSLSIDQIVKEIKDKQGNALREEIVVPVGDYQHTGILDYNLPLAPSDVIYVPPAGSVFVQGRVQNPGIVYLGPSIQTLTHAITKAGGMRFSAKSRVEVVRDPQSGHPKSYTFNARDMMERKTEDFMLEDGDQIFVNPTFWRVALEGIGTVLGRGTSAGINATVNPVTK